MIHLLPGFLACILALITFRKLDVFSRLIAVQVCLACIVEFVGWQLRISAQRNTWLYNAYMPLEFTLLFLATMLQFKGWTRFWLAKIIVLYWVCWIAELYLFSFHSFAVRTYVLGAIILLVNYFFVVYKSAWSPHPLLSQSRFWFSIGVILFFGCNIPFFSMYDYIIANSTMQQMRLLSNLMIVFSYFRYLCTSVGFIIVFREARKMAVNPY